MNVNSVRQKVAQAIAKMPTVITLQRYEKIPDGIGGFTVSDTPATVATVNGLLDNSGHSFISTATVDAGAVKRERTPKLIVVYDAGFAVMENDFFTVGGITHKVNNPVNILNLNIYWDCDIEVVR